MKITKSTVEAAFRKQDLDTLMKMVAQATDEQRAEPQQYAAQLAINLGNRQAMKDLLKRGDLVVMVSEGLKVKYIEKYVTPLYKSANIEGLIRLHKDTSEPKSIRIEAGEKVVVICVEGQNFDGLNRIRTDEKNLAEIRVFADMMLIAVAKEDKTTYRLEAMTKDPNETDEFRIEAGKALVDVLCLARSKGESRIMEVAINKEKKYLPEVATYAKEKVKTRQTKDIRAADKATEAARQRREAAKKPDKVDVFGSRDELRVTIKRRT